MNKKIVSTDLADDKHPVILATQSYLKSSVSAFAVKPFLRLFIFFLPEKESLVLRGIAAGCVDNLCRISGWKTYKTIRIAG